MLDECDGGVELLDGGCGDGDKAGGAQDAVFGGHGWLSLVVVV